MHLEFAQTVHRTAEQYVGFHTHPALEIVYFIRGKGESKVGDTPHEVGKNFFTVNPAGTPHDQTNRPALTSLCFGISDSGLEKYAGAYADRGGEVGQVCAKLMEELKSDRAGKDEITRGLVLQLVGLVRRVAEEGNRAPRKKELVDHALGIIRDRSGNISVAELSEQLFVSKDYLRHLFKEYSQNSPMKHLISARVERAKSLLSSAETPVSEVAEKAGFENPYYFSRLFKQVTGLTPSEFRKRKLPE